MDTLQRTVLLADQLLDIVQPEIDRKPRHLDNLTVVFDALSTVLAPMIAESAAREIWDQALAREGRDWW